jgi:hypothetical protein
MDGLGISPIPLPKTFVAELRRSDGIVSILHIDGDRRRIERHWPNGRVEIIIARPDLGLAYQLIPDQKLCVEMPLAPGSIERVWNPLSVGFWVPSGSEMIDGVLCDRYEARLRNEPSTCYEIYWLARDSRMWRRIVTIDTNGKPVLTCDYVNVSLEPPDPRVFEPPPNYERLWYTKASKKSKSPGSPW